MKETVPRLRMLEKRPIVVAILIFVLTTVAIVIINSLMRRAFLLNYSISRYVGSETWSAVVFGVVNYVVAFSVLTYLYRVGEKWKFQRWYYWIVVLTVVGLVGLSMCPIGYFDQPGSEFASSAPSHVHEICSRTMFVGMMVLVAMICFSKKTSRVTRMMAVAYIIYGMLCALGFIIKAPWFLGNMLVFESCYTFGFLALCLGL